MRKAKEDALKNISTLLGTRRSRLNLSLPNIPAARRIDFDRKTESEQQVIDNLNLILPNRELGSDMATEIFKTRKHIDNCKEFDGSKRNFKKFINNLKFVFENLPEETDKATTKCLVNYAAARLCTPDILAKLEQKSIENFSEFEDALEEIVYGSPEINQVNAILDATKQGKGETISNFAFRILEEKHALDLALKKGNMAGEVGEALSRTFLFNAFIRNLRPELNRICISKGFKTIEEAVKDIQKIEQLITTEEDTELLKKLTNQLSIKPPSYGDGANRFYRNRNNPIHQFRGNYYNQPRPRLFWPGNQNNQGNYPDRRNTGFSRSFGYQAARPQMEWRHNNGTDTNWGNKRSGETTGERGNNNREGVQIGNQGDTSNTAGGRREKSYETQSSRERPAQTGAKLGMFNTPKN